MNYQQEEDVAKYKIKVFLEESVRFEKEGNASGALECCEKALETAEAFSLDREKLNIHIRFASLYQMLGRLEEGLQHFEATLDLSCLLKDKIAQVDSLINIASSYLYKDEYSAGCEYIEKADELLANMDYIKGKVNSGIFWARYYYFNNNNRIKAAEICNNSLKLCTEDLLVEKGTILNILAELHSDLISDEEYLDLFMQAYKCFEKAGYTRGIIGMLNNIGYVYDFRFQHYEKSLEYFLQAKQKSENSMFEEFALLSYINIGELYFKLFKYEEALMWLLESKNKPKGTYHDKVRLYSYVILMRIYFQLCNYKEAYNYFILAAKEAENNHASGMTLATYYSSAALLFSEFGNNEEAQKYSQRALEAISNEGLLLKWETGIIYEQIKLKTAKSESEIIDILEAVKYSLSNYKNQNTILDIVYTLCIQLLELGYPELSYNLFSEFNTESSGVDVITIKRIYLESAFTENQNDKLSKLEVALDLALKDKDYKMLIRIYNNIGDCFHSMGNGKEAETNYNKALESFNVILEKTPEEFRLN